MTTGTSPSDQLDAVARALRSSSHDGRPTRVSVIGQTYPTTAEDLWEACTTPDRIARWFTGVSGDLHQGGRYQLEGNAGGTVTACDPPRSFEATWEFGDGVSWIRVQVLPAGDGARLELEHSALEEDAVEFWDRYGPGATGVGWDLGMLGLRLHLQNPQAGRPEHEQFATSPEGVALITGASERWGDASIVFGTPETAARAAQARTTAFYTGTEPPA